VLIKVGSDCFDWAPFLLYFKGVVVGLLNARRPTNKLQERYSQSVSKLNRHPSQTNKTTIPSGPNSGRQSRKSLQGAQNLVDRYSNLLADRDVAVPDSFALFVEKPNSNANLDARFEGLENPISPQGSVQGGAEFAKGNTDEAEAARNAAVAAENEGEEEEEKHSVLVLCCIGVFNNAVDRTRDNVQVGHAEFAFVFLTTLVTVLVDLNVAVISFSALFHIVRSQRLAKCIQANIYAGWKGDLMPDLNFFGGTRFEQIFEDATGGASVVGVIPGRQMPVRLGLGKLPRKTESPAGFGDLKLNKLPHASPLASAAPEDGSRVMLTQIDSLEAPPTAPDFSTLQ
jgi:hypothetical protein